MGSHTGGRLTSYGFKRNWGGGMGWRPVGPTGRGRVWGGPSQGAPMLTTDLAGVFGASMRSHAAHPPAGEPSGTVARLRSQPCDTDLKLSTPLTLAHLD